MPNQHHHWVVKNYALGFLDSVSRVTWLYFLHTRIDAVKYVRKYLAIIRAVGIPSNFAPVQSDSTDEFDPNGPFGDLCRRHGIKMDVSPGERDA